MTMAMTITTAATTSQTVSRAPAMSMLGSAVPEGVFSTRDKVMYLEKKIVESKKEAAILKYQIDKVKTRMNDESLSTTARNVSSIVANSCNLKRYMRLQGHRDKISSMAWGDDSRHLVTVSQDGFLILWDAITGLKTNAIMLDSEWVLTCAYSPNGRLAASAGLKNTCAIYNLSERAVVVPSGPRSRNYVSHSSRYEMASLQPMRGLLKGHRCYISDCDFLDDESIITASGDLSCALWDIEKSHKVKEYNQHLGDVLCIAVKRGQGQTFISGSSDGFARVWDVRSPVPVHQYQVSDSDTTSVSFFPDHGSFAVGSDDGVVRLFDLRADCKLEEYSLPMNLHQQVQESRLKKAPYYQISETSSLLRSSDSSRSVNSDIDTLGISSLDFSKSGRLLYVCYPDLGCVIWDVLKSEIVGELQQHNGRINQVRTSADGTAVATVSWDSTANIWSS